MSVFMKIKTRTGLFRSLCLLLCMPSTAVSDPLYVKNLSPYAATLGFPNLQSGQPLGKDQTKLSLHGQVANTSTDDTTTTESVLLDGETHRVAARYQRGIGKEWQVTLEVPWVRHSGGFLDKPIEQWHDFWGLPNGNRDELPRNQLLYAYDSPGFDYRYQDSQSGLGDTQISVQRSLYSKNRIFLSLHAGVELPTGNEDKLSGNGKADYFFGLNASGLHDEAKLNWHTQLGYLRAGELDSLAPIQKRDLWYASAGLVCKAWPSVHLKAQLDSHAAPFDSQLPQLGDHAVLLSLGAGFQIGEQLQLEVSFYEDIAVDTAPDFTVQAGLRYRPRL